MERVSDEDGEWTDVYIAVVEVNLDPKDGCHGFPRVLGVENHGKINHQQGEENHHGQQQCAHGISSPGSRKLLRGVLVDRFAACGAIFSALCLLCALWLHLKGKHAQRTHRPLLNVAHGPACLTLGSIGKSWRYISVN